jgi:hypothetical protein
MVSRKRFNNSRYKKYEIRIDMDGMYEAKEYHLSGFPQLPKEEVPCSRPKNSVKRVVVCLGMFASIMSFGVAIWLY